jgi:hypothetical protein
MGQPPSGDVGTAPRLIISFWDPRMEVPIGNNRFAPLLDLELLALTRAGALPVGSG